MSTLRLTTISNQTGSASVPSDTIINGSAKAWVNFTNALEDANYSASCMGGATASIGWSRVADSPAQTTSAFRMIVGNATGTALADASVVNANFFR